jgi:hypothetical protein
VTHGILIRHNRNWDESMQRRSKILGLLLIAALALATSPADVWAEAGHAFGVAATPGEHSTACHAHMADIPANSQATEPSRSHSLPAPANYQCCLTGHDAAIVQARHYQQTCAQFSRFEFEIEPAAALCFSGHVQLSRVVCTDPPGTNPLRV